jgi:aminocarboxymuconate-semialdehyde decarboxylase
LAVTKAIAIDTHAHFFPESYIKLIADHGSHCGAAVTRDDQGQFFIQVGLLLRTGPIVPAFYDFDARIAEMDREGVDVHVLSLTQSLRTFDFAAARTE